jgi:hypothetical protein
LVHPFPERVSYNRFVELEKDEFFPLTIFTRRSRDWPHVENVLMNINDKILIRKRAVIKTVNDDLKNIAQIEHSRHRSFKYFIAYTLSLLLPIVSLKRSPPLKWNFSMTGN